MCLDLDVCCSKGTYIRTLAQDLGEQLGWCAPDWSAPNGQRRRRFVTPSRWKP